MAAKRIRPLRPMKGKRLVKKQVSTATMNISGLDVEENNIDESAAANVPTRRKIKKPKKTSVRVSKNRALTKAKRLRTTTGGKGRLPAFFNKRYQLKKPIGSGGAGTVYKAFDKVLDMDVAIKFLPERVSKKKDELERFKLEASIAMKLSHRYIVTLHNLDMSRGRYFLIMQYVAGNDFRTILNGHGRISPAVTLQVLSCCAEALDYAHEHGVVHRDLKPENLMLDENQVLKIIDFGTARLGGLSDDAGPKYIEGTPPYISPEQILCTSLDRRTDVYSLGVIAHEFLDGTPPYPIGTSVEEILQTAPRPLTSAPGAVANVVSTAMAPDPNDRWETAGEFVGALGLALGTTDADE